jgi:hypothetical protein
MVGEIVIAPEYVRFDRVGVEELVVHGALHLAGMDHGDRVRGYRDGGGAGGSVEERRCSGEGSRDAKRGEKLVRPSKGQQGVALSFNHAYEV